MPQHDAAVQTKLRSEHLLGLRTTIETFYASVMTCIRYTSAQPLRIGRERLFALVSNVVTKRAQEESDVRLGMRSRVYRSGDGSGRTNPLNALLCTPRLSAGCPSPHSW